MSPNGSRVIGESSCPLGDPRSDARGQRAERDQHADDEDELVRLRQLARTAELLHAAVATADFESGCDAVRVGVGLARRRARPASSFFEKPGCVEQRVERALAELRELQLGVGDDARVARRAVEQGEVAEEAARPERRPPPGRGARPGPGPSRITKNSVPAAPSVTTTLPAGTVTSLGRLRHHLQLLLGAGGEEGHRGQGVDERDRFGPWRGIYHGRDLGPDSSRECTGRKPES